MSSSATAEEMLESWNWSPGPVDPANLEKVVELLANDQKILCSDAAKTTLFTKYEHEIQSSFDDLVLLLFNCYALS